MFYYTLKICYVDINRGKMFSQVQILAIIGFIIILISIPASFMLVSKTQILKSSAQETKKTTTSQTVDSKPVTKAKEVPATNTLAELNKLISGSQQGATPAATPSTITPTPTDVQLGFGPTLSVKIALEGRKTGNQQSSKVFVGISSGTVTIKPTYLLTYTVDFPDSGLFRGLSLAGLNPGSVYTAYVKGPSQIDSASTFTMAPTESSLNSDQALTLTSGDLNEDNTINTTDYTIAKSLYGATKSSAAWNERADLNADGIINNLDLGVIMKNLGKTGASGIWASTPPVATQSGGLNIRLNTGGPASPIDTNQGGEPDPNKGGYWMWVPPIN